MMWFVVAVVILIAVAAFASLSRDDAAPSNVKTIDRGSPQDFLQRSHSRILEAQDIIDRAKGDLGAGALNQEQLASGRDRLGELYAQQLHEPPLDASALQNPAVLHWIAQIGEGPADAVAPDMSSLEYLHSRYWMFFLHAHLWTQELHAKISSTALNASDSEVAASLSAELAELKAHAQAIKRTRS